MMSTLSRFRNLPYALAASATVALMAEQAAAQDAGGNNIGTIAGSVRDQMGNVGQLMVAGAFVGGLVMLATGLMKLKQAADTQGNQVKYSEGMWRVAVGAGLVAIPAFSGVLTTSLGLGSDQSITSMGGASF